MERQMRTRLHELEEQLELGERRLRELESDATQLRCALLRIAGAAGILRELLGAEPAGELPSTPHDHREGPWVQPDSRPGRRAVEDRCRTSDA